jgi:hypothetical protein
MVATGFRVRALKLLAVRGAPQYIKSRIQVLSIAGNAQLFNADHSLVTLLIYRLSTVSRSTLVLIPSFLRFNILSLCFYPRIASCFLLEATSQFRSALFT